jgi:hypothetical protein
MTYTTMGLARAILAIKRGLEAEGKQLTIENVYGHLFTSLPDDITLGEFKRAIFMAAELHLAQNAQRRRRQGGAE